MQATKILVRVIAKKKMQFVSNAKKIENPSETDEIACLARDEVLNRPFERLWKRDFENSEFETKFRASLEDKSTLEVMERTTLKMVIGISRFPCPGVVVLHRAERLPSEKTTAENEVLFEKGFQKEELEVKDRVIRYLPHRPITYPLKPDKL